MPLQLLSFASAIAGTASPPTCEFKVQNHTCLKSGYPTGARIIQNVTYKTLDGASKCCAACDANAQCNSWNWLCLNAGCNGTQPDVAAGWSPHFGLCTLKSDDGQIKKPEALGPKTPPTPAPAPAPLHARNVLYILVDDLRTQFNETYGHEFMVTPNIDAFAKQSLVFEQAHVNSQMCVPTRNSFMTGRRPETTRVFNSMIGVDNFRVTGKNWTTHPGYFMKHGYFTTGVGKTFHPNKPPNFDQCCSWSDVDTLPYFYPTPESCPNKNDVWCRVDNATAVYEDDLILNEAIRRLTLAAKDERPFFLNVGFHKPHTPYRAPGKFYDLYPDASEIATAKFADFPVKHDELGKTTGLAWFLCQAEDKQYPINHSIVYPTKVQQELRLAYYASVSFTDHNIGQLLKAVDSMTFKFGKPIVVLHGDHGYQLGERNIYCKESNFNLATHVPLIVQLPVGHPYHAASSGARTNALVEIVSIMPTLIELAGLPAFDAVALGEPPLGGRSFASLLANPSSSSSSSSSSSLAALDDDGPVFNASYSQYGRNRCDGDLFDNKKEEKTCTLRQYMGISVRIADYRLTEWWLCNNVTGVPHWSTPGGATGVELYDHSKGAAARTDDYDSAAEVVNLAGEEKYEEVQAQLHAMLRARF